MKRKRHLFSIHKKMNIGVTSSSKKQIIDTNEKN